MSVRSSDPEWLDCCLPSKTLAAFISYSWPENIRELQNLIERAVIRSNDGILPNPLTAEENNAVTPPQAQGTFSDSTRISHPASVEGN
jgi:DNA-binding NtrC family response regulator